MYSQVFVVFFAILSVHCVVGDKVAWKPCASTAGTAKDLVVVGCDTDVCPLKRGTNATLIITFESNVASDNLTATVYGVVFGIKTKFNLPNPDSCKGVGIECPIKAGQTYVYTNTLEVKTGYPRVTVEILWELKDDNGDLVSCSTIPAKIV